MFREGNWLVSPQIYLPFICFFIFWLRSFKRSCYSRQEYYQCNIFWWKIQNGECFFTPKKEKLKHMKLYLPHLNHLNDSITGHQGCYILRVVIYTLPHALFFSYIVLHSLSHYKQTLVIYTLAAIIFAIISNSIKIKDVTMYKITQNIKT